MATAFDHSDVLARLCVVDSLFPGWNEQWLQRWQVRRGQQCSGVTTEDEEIGWPHGAIRVTFSFADGNLAGIVKLADIGGPDLQQPVEIV